ncbi:hypothetical protein [Modestobacter sp. I12A-02662]|uniref:hypothetical protein n=1 Tax=Modestobacter sp. I12A-02662 TaxID=1730496 RepID=UPI0034DF5290
MGRTPVVVVVLLLAGCAAEDGAPAGQGTPPVGAPPVGAPTVSAPPAVAGIEAEAVRLRSDVTAGRRLQVRISDTGPAPFTVTSVQLDTPGFAALPPRDTATEFTPGRVIDLPVERGAVDCATRPEPAAARLTVVRPDGTTEELRVPLGGDTLARLHAQECAAEALLAVVDVRVEDLAGEGDTLAGDVVLTRRSGDDEIVVSELSPSVVLAPVPHRQLPLRLAPGEERLELPVTFDATRCDPHALAETKQPFVFPVRVTVGDGEDALVDLPLDDGQRARLQEFLTSACR